MSQFAKINSDNIVQRVLVIEQEFIDTGIVGDSALWIQCSHDNNLRKQCPVNGSKYDKDNDIFIAPQPYPSWALDGSFYWQPPTAMPDDDKRYTWDEPNTKWIEVSE